MNSIVCIKKIQDPEIPPAKFKLDPGLKKVIPPEGIPPVINPYDEQAVELALRLKEKHGGRVTVISIDREVPSRVVKHALAMGADEGVLLSDEAFEGSDSFSTAYLLSRAVRKAGEFDLVLCGRQAADWDEGLVGPLLAADLDLPLVALASDIAFTGNAFKVKRVTLDGHQVFSVPSPAVVTVSSEVGRPRLPSGWGIIAASQKKVPVWNARDIAADLSRVGAHAARRKLVRLFIPERTRKCVFMEGKDVSEASAELAVRLRKSGVI